MLSVIYCKYIVREVVMIILLDELLVGKNILLCPFTCGRLLTFLEAFDLFFYFSLYCTRSDASVPNLTECFLVLKINNHIIV